MNVQMNRAEQRPVRLIRDWLAAFSHEGQAE